MTFDEKDSARAAVDIISDEHGEYNLVAIEVQIEQDKWDTILSSTVDAAMFVSWLESKRVS